MLAGFQIPWLATEPHDCAMIATVACCAEAFAYLHSENYKMG